MAVKARGAGAEFLIVVGSSAGGIDALSKLMGGLAPDLPAAIVVAQHLEPGRRSMLQEILQRRTTIPVVVVDGKTLLGAGKVYVIPAGSNAVVNRGLIELRPDGSSTSHPSLDLVLTSAATAYAERLFAVVLTGKGSDGANGAVAVKKAGGTVIIQDPKSAAYPSMPRALPPTAVDHVAAVEEIGPLLGQLLAHASSARDRQEVVAGHLATIIGIVGSRSNIDFRPYRPTTIIRRVERRMAAVRAATIEDYAKYLEAHPEESPALVNALLIKVTEFFRDPEAFDYIRASVLPSIVERARTGDRRLRLWSAGCATGEEAYSLAMIVADLVGPESAEWSIRVFATDLHEEAVEFARRAVYPEAILANVPDAYRERFFEQAEPGSYRVVKSLRQVVIYGQQDLSHGVPFPRIDLVVCRNLLIYFQPQLQGELLDLFAYSLQSTRGYLFLGKAETARPSNASFELVNKKWKIYRCVSGPMSSAFRGSTVRSTRIAPGAGKDAPGVGPEAPEGKGPRAFGENIIRSIQVGAVVIDAAYRTVNMNAAARRLLGVREHAAERDFLHSVRGIPYAEVRTAIDFAAREGQPVSLPDVSLGLGDSAEPRFVTLTISPLEGEATGAYLVVTVVDSTDTVQTRRRLEAAEKGQKQLVEELTETNARLNEANKDLLDANEELQAANEELMLAQEELQATNEEFEATNEELQATNEELETNNEELQATNEEIDTTNEELQARTVNLEEMRAAMNAERGRLAEIVEDAPIPILILRGAALTVERANESFKEVVGRGIAEGQSLEEALATLPGIIAGAREAFEKDAPWTSGPTVVETGAQCRGGSCVFMARPLHEKGVPAGVALYATEEKAEG